MAEDYSEILFQSIDTIIEQRLKNLPYDRTIVATIIDNTQAVSNNLYQVTTDDFIQFYAYSETMDYNIDDRVYIRIPAGDYTQQKIIIGRYIPESLTTISNINNGFFYKGEEKDGEYNEDYQYTFLKEQYDGYNGFDLYFTLQMPQLNDNPELAKDLKVEIKTFDNENVEVTSFPILTGSDLVTNYNNLYDGRLYEKHINFPLNNNETKITVQLTGNDKDELDTIKCVCSFGYLLPDKLNSNSLYLLLYSPDGGSIYYAYQGAETTRNLNLRLLKINTTTGLMTAEPTPFAEGSILTFGIANDKLQMSNNINLQGRYYFIEKQLSDINGLEDITNLGKISFDNGEIKIENIPISSVSRSTNIRVFYDDGTESTSGDALSNIYTFYGQANNTISGRRLTLEADQDTFYVYGLSNKIVPPELAFKDYTLTLTYENTNDADDILDDSNNIEITIPNSDTMIASCGEEPSIDENRKKATWKFKIKDYYIPTAHNNTITITVKKDGQTYTIQKEFLFGSNSSQGDDYILNMWLGDESHNLLSGLHENDIGYIYWELYNYQYNLIKEGRIADNIERGKIYELKLNASGDIVTDNPIIQGFLPIPDLGDGIGYANAPTTIIYNITGKMPDYYKDKLQLFDKYGIELSDIRWSIEPEDENNGPVINNNQLYARTIYYNNNIEYVLTAKDSNDIPLYSCPLYIGQNKYYKPVIVQEQNNTQSSSSSDLSYDIKDAAIGRVESDGSRLYMGTIDTSSFGLYAYNSAGKQTLGLTGSGISILGQPITFEDEKPYWNAKVNSSISADKLNIETIGAINKPVYFNNGIPVAFNTQIGAATNPIYVNEAGELTPLPNITINGNNYDLITALNKIISALTNNVAIQEEHTLWQDT